MTEKRAFIAQSPCARMPEKLRWCALCAGRYQLTFAKTLSNNRAAANTASNFVRKAY